MTCNKHRARHARHNGGTQEAANVICTQRPILSVKLVLDYGYVLEKSELEARDRGYDFIARKNAGLESGLDELSWRRTSLLRADDNRHVGIAQRRPRAGKGDVRPPIWIDKSLDSTCLESAATP